MEKITAIKGMNDVLPDDSHAWLWLEDLLKKWLSSYGYSNIRTPIVEETKLFARAIGEVTDIVEKEMYSFVDSLNGDDLTLRPEGTAGVVRAVLEHNLLYNASQKLWYMGPMFRHERPQKGRYRQFHQLGVEALGFSGAEIDAEMIVMLADLWQRLGIKNLELQINCLGSKAERSEYRVALVEYFAQYQKELDEDSKRRLAKNPLRLLDSKNQQIRELVNNAPKLIDFLGDESLRHYNKVKLILEQMAIPYVENHALVRGLDYYSLTVFEWVSSNLGAQGTVAAGGRYNDLVRELGGNENEAIGFAIGIERLLLEIAELNLMPNKEKYDVFIANSGDGTELLAFKIAKLARNAGFSVVQNFTSSSFKSQFKKANALGVKTVLVVGEEELAKGMVTVKNMEQNSQESVPLNDIINRLK